MGKRDKKDNPRSTRRSRRNAEIITKRFFTSPMGEFASEQLLHLSPQRVGEVASEAVGEGSRRSVCERLNGWKSRWESDSRKAIYAST
jgi:hypothetical protein